MSTPEQDSPQVDHRALAERYLRDAPSAGAMNYGRLIATVGVGHALLALVDRLAPPAPKEDQQ